MVAPVKKAVATKVVPDADAAPVVNVSVTPTPAVVSTLPAIPLPTWTDAASISSYLTTILAGVLAFITGLHPGFSEPAIVQTLVTTVSVVVAAAAQAINVLTHRSVVKAITAAHVAVATAGK